MKKIIAMVLVVILTLMMVQVATACNEQPEVNRYALTTKVVEFDFDEDAVICEDCNGNLWAFYGIEDWDIGDCASLVMNDNGTEIIYDDIIENVRYSAWELYN